MPQNSVQSTTGYINYVYNISARGVTQVTSQLLGLSGIAGNILGQLAFQTSSYLSNTENSIITLGIVATAGFTKASQQALKFNQELATIGAISGRTTSEVGSLGDKAMDMSAKFGVAVGDMTKGLESLARAGVSENNMAGILEEAMGLSKLEGLTLDQSINDLISTTNLLDTKGLDLQSDEYVDAIKQRNQQITATSEAAPINAQDIIHTLEHVGGYASSANIDQDDLFAVIAQLGSKGTKSEIAGTSLRAFLAAGQKDTAQRALKRIGLDVKDLWKDDNAMMSISDMKDVLDEAMEARGYTKQEKLEFYSDFAGYKQANQIMKIDTGSVREFKEKIDHSWDMGKKIDQVIGTAQTNLQGMFQAGVNFLTKVGEPLLPIITIFAKFVTKTVNLIDSIPGIHIVGALGLALVSIKSISMLVNKLVPQIFLTKGSIGGIGKIVRGIHDDVEETINFIKGINTLNPNKTDKNANRKEYALNQYISRVNDEDKVKYARELNPNVSEILDVEFVNFVNKDEIKDNKVSSFRIEQLLAEKEKKEDKKDTTIKTTTEKSDSPYRDRNGRLKQTIFAPDHKLAISNKLSETNEKLGELKKAFDVRDVLSSLTSAINSLTNKSSETIKVDVVSSVCCNKDVIKRDIKNKDVVKKEIIYEDHITGEELAKEMPRGNQKSPKEIAMKKGKVLNQIVDTESPIKKYITKNSSKIDIEELDGIKINKILNDSKTVYDFLKIDFNSNKVSAQYSGLNKTFSKKVSNVLFDIKNEIAKDLNKEIDELIDKNQYEDALKKINKMKEANWDYTVFGKTDFDVRTAHIYNKMGQHQKVIDDFEVNDNELFKFLHSDPFAHKTNHGYDDLINEINIAKKNLGIKVDKNVQNQKISNEEVSHNEINSEEYEQWMNSNNVHQISTSTMNLSAINGISEPMGNRGMEKMLGIKNNSLTLNPNFELGGSGSSNRTTSSYNDESVQIYLDSQAVKSSQDLRQLNSEIENLKKLEEKSRIKLKKVTGQEKLQLRNKIEVINSKINNKEKRVEKLKKELRNIPSITLSEKEIDKLDETNFKDILMPKIANATVNLKNDFLEGEGVDPYVGILGQRSEEISNAALEMLFTKNPMFSGASDAGLNYQIGILFSEIQEMKQDPRFVTTAMTKGNIKELDLDKKISNMPTSITRADLEINKLVDQKKIDRIEDFMDNGMTLGYLEKYGIKTIQEIERAKQQYNAKSITLEERNKKIKDALLLKSGLFDDLEKKFKNAIINPSTSTFIDTEMSEQQALKDISKNKKIKINSSALSIMNFNEDKEMIKEGKTISDSTISKMFKGKSFSKDFWEIGSNLTEEELDILNDYLQGEGIDSYGYGGNKISKSIAIKKQVIQLMDEYEERNLKKRKDLLSNIGVFATNEMINKINEKDFIGEEIFNAMSQSQINKKKLNPLYDEDLGFAYDYDKDFFKENYKLIANLMEISLKNEDGTFRTKNEVGEDLKNKHILINQYRNKELTRKEASQYGIDKNSLDLNQAIDKILLLTGSKNQNVLLLDYQIQKVEEKNKEINKISKKIDKANNEIDRKNKKLLVLKKDKEKNKDKIEKIEEKLKILRNKKGNLEEKLKDVEDKRDTLKNPLDDFFKQKDIREETLPLQLLKYVEEYANQTGEEGFNAVNLDSFTIANTMGIAPLGYQEQIIAGDVKTGRAFGDAKGQNVSIANKHLSAAEYENILIDKEKKMNLLILEKYLRYIKREYPDLMSVLPVFNILDTNDMSSLTTGDHSLDSDDINKLAVKIQASRDSFGIEYTDLRNFEDNASLYGLVLLNEKNKETSSKSLKKIGALSEKELLKLTILPRNGIVSPHKAGAVKEVSTIQDAKGLFVRKSLRHKGSVFTDDDDNVIGIGRNEDGTFSHVTHVFKQLRQDVGTNYDNLVIAEAALLHAGVDIRDIYDKITPEQEDRARLALASQDAVQSPLGGELSMGVLPGGIISSRVEDVNEVAKENPEYFNQMLNEVGSKTKKLTLDEYETYKKSGKIYSNDSKTLSEEALLYKIKNTSFDDYEKNIEKIKKEREELMNKYSKIKTNKKQSNFAIISKDLENKIKEKEDELKREENKIKSIEKSIKKIKNNSQDFSGVRNIVEENGKFYVEVLDFNNQMGQIYNIAEQPTTVEDFKRENPEEYKNLIQLDASTTIFDEDGRDTGGRLDYIWVNAKELKRRQNAGLIDKRTEGDTGVLRVAKKEDTGYGEDYYQISNWEFNADLTTTARQIAINDYIHNRSMAQALGRSEGAFDFERIKDDTVSNLHQKMYPKKKRKEGKKGKTKKLGGKRRDKKPSESFIKKYNLFKEQFYKDSDQKAFLSIAALKYPELYEKFKKEIEEEVSGADLAQQIHHQSDMVQTTNDYRKEQDYDEANPSWEDIIGNYQDETMRGFDKLTFDPQNPSGDVSVDVDDLNRRNKEGEFNEDTMRVLNEYGGDITSDLTNLKYSDKTISGTIDYQDDSIRETWNIISSVEKEKAGILQELKETKESYGEHNQKILAEVQTKARDSIVTTKFEDSEIDEDYIKEGGFTALYAAINDNPQILENQPYVNQFHKEAGKQVFPTMPGVIDPNILLLPPAKIEEKNIEVDADNVKVETETSQDQEPILMGPVSPIDILSGQGAIFTPNYEYYDALISVINAGFNKVTELLSSISFIGPDSEYIREYEEEVSEETKKETKKQEEEKNNIKLPQNVFHKERNKPKGLFNTINDFVEGNKNNDIINKIMEKEFEFNEDGINIITTFDEKLESATDKLTKWETTLLETSDFFAPLAVAVRGVTETINTVKKGNTLISDFIGMGQNLASGKELEIFGVTIDNTMLLGKVFQDLSIGVSELIPTIMGLLGPIAVISASIWGLIKIINWSEESHKQNLKQLEAQQKENKSKGRSYQAKTEQAKKLAEGNRNPIKQDYLDNKYYLAQVQLDNANMNRAYTSIEKTDEENDSIWGKYGIRANIDAFKGNYESTADEYEGTSKQIRKIKEGSLGHLFNSSAVNQATAYYDANQSTIGIIDEYKDELGQLYDVETNMQEKVGPEGNARDTQQFQQALDKFVEATGITRDHAEKYLDYMQTEHNVDQATQAMQAEADSIKASTELKVQAIAFGGNPADVLGLNGIENQQKAMVKAQADLIKMELSDQLFWKSITSTLMIPIKLIIAPIFSIVDILSAIWLFLTGNWSDAFNRASQAGSRFGAVSEATTYWTAWGETQTTDFSSIGNDAIDNRDRADYGNKAETKVRKTPIRSNNNPQSYVSGSGYYSGGSGGGSAYASDSSLSIISPLNSIVGMLGTIVGVLTSGVLIFGLVKGIRSLLGNTGELTGVLGKIFNTEGFNDIKESIKNKLGKFFNIEGIKDLFGQGKDKVSDLGIKDKIGTKVFGAEGQRNTLGKWKDYLSGSQKINNLLGKKPEIGERETYFFNGEERDDKYVDKVTQELSDDEFQFLRDEYGISNGSNRNIISELIYRDKWDEARGKLNKQRQKSSPLNKWKEVLYGDTYQFDDVEKITDLSFDELDFLAEEYNIKGSNQTMTRNMLRNYISKDEQWEDAKAKIQKRRGGSLKNVIKNKYIEPWKEYGNKYLYGNGGESQDVSDNILDANSLTEDERKYLALKYNVPMMNAQEILQDQGKWEEAKAEIKNRRDRQAYGLVGVYKNKMEDKKQEYIEKGKGFINSQIDLAESYSGKNITSYTDPKTGETIYYNVKTGKKVDIDPRTGKPVGTNVATRYISKGLEWRDKLGFGGGEGPSIFEAIKDPEKMEEYVKTKIENADSKSIIGQTRDALKDPEQLAKNARAYKSGDLNKEDVTIPIRVMSNLLDIDDAIKTGDPEEVKKVLNKKFDKVKDKIDDMFNIEGVDGEDVTWKDRFIAVKDKVMEYLGLSNTINFEGERPDWDLNEKIKEYIDNDSVNLYNDENSADVAYQEGIGTYMNLARINSADEYITASRHEAAHFFLGHTSEDDSEFRDDEFYNDLSKDYQHQYSEYEARLFEKMVHEAKGEEVPQQLLDELAIYEENIGKDNLAKFISPDFMKDAVQGYLDNEEAINTMHLSTLMQNRDMVDPALMTEIQEKMGITLDESDPIQEDIAESSRDTVTLLEEIRNEVAEWSQGMEGTAAEIAGKSAMNSDFVQGMKNASDNGLGTPKHDTKKATEWFFGGQDAYENQYAEDLKEANKTATENAQRQIQEERVPSLIAEGEEFASSNEANMIALSAKNAAARSNVMTGIYNAADNDVGLSAIKAEAREIQGNSDFPAMMRRISYGQKQRGTKYPNHSAGYHEAQIVAGNIRNQDISEYADIDGIKNNPLISAMNVARTRDKERSIYSQQKSGKETKEEKRDKVNEKLGNLSFNNKEKSGFLGKIRKNSIPIQSTVPLKHETIPRTVDLSGIEESLGISDTLDSLSNVSDITKLGGDLLEGVGGKKTQKVRKMLNKTSDVTGDLSKGGSSKLLNKGVKRAGSGLGKLGKGVGKAGFKGAGAIGKGIGKVGGSLAKGGTKAIGKGVGKVGGKLLGKVAGKVGGKAIGGAIGAAVGSSVPIVGTIIGFLAGEVLGELAGPLIEKGIGAIGGVGKSVKRGLGFGPAVRSNNKNSALNNPLIKYNPLMYTPIGMMAKGIMGDGPLKGVFGGVRKFFGGGPRHGKSPGMFSGVGKYIGKAGAIGLGSLGGAAKHGADNLFNNVKSGISNLFNNKKGTSIKGSLTPTKVGGGATFNKEYFDKVKTFAEKNKDNKTIQEENLKVNKKTADAVQNNQNNTQTTGGNITIENININTSDDPESIKEMFLELIIELQEQVNPRIVSRTINGSANVINNNIGSNETTTNNNGTNNNGTNT